MKPAEIIADPIEFERWWQERQPTKLDRRIKRAAVEAGLITIEPPLILLTKKGRLHRAKAYVGRLSPRLRRALAEVDRAKAALVEDAT